ncbi:unnamed protein product [Brassica oleracea]
MCISCMVVQSSFHCHLSIPSVSKRTKRSSGSQPKLSNYILTSFVPIKLYFSISITILQKDFESCLLQKDRSILVCPNVTEPTNPIKRCSLLFSLIILILFEIL